MIDPEELPSRRHESWRWSNLRAAAQTWAPALLEITAERRHAGEAARHRGDFIGQLANAYGVVEQRNIVGRAEEVVAPSEALRTEDLVIAEGGELVRVILQRPCSTPWLMHTRVRVEAGARYRQFVLALGSNFARLETSIDLVGEGASVELSGVYLCGLDRHADLTSHVVHSAPATTTMQTVRGASRRGGRGVFQGRVDVAKGAHGADASQHHAGLMLEEGGEIFAKPELRISCDDVQCAHGSTVGALEESALFYLRTRGLPEAAARAMLTEAFLLGATPDWLSAEVRAEVEGHVRAWLEAAE